MKNYLGACALGLFGLFSLGVAPAGAEYRDREWNDSRPDFCSVDHDHRAHDRNYYDYYQKDSYYRADPGFSSSRRYSDTGYDDRYGGGYDGRDRDRRDDSRYASRYRYGDRDDDDDGYWSRRYGYRRGGDYDGRVVSRRSHQIPGSRATAYVVEQEYHTSRGHERVCTVSVNGPDARYVDQRDLRWVASTHCSRYARIRYS
jgi:hypothetical protein